MLSIDTAVRFVARYTMDQAMESYGYTRCLKPAEMEKFNKDQAWISKLQNFYETEITSAIHVTY